MGEIQVTGTQSSTQSWAARADAAADAKRERDLRKAKPPPAADTAPTHAGWTAKEGNRTITYA